MGLALNETDIVELTLGVDVVDSVCDKDGDNVCDALAETDCVCVEVMLVVFEKLSDDE